MSSSALAVRRTAATGKYHSAGFEHLAVGICGCLERSGCGAVSHSIVQG